MASIDLASPTVSAGGNASALAKQRVADGIVGLKSYGLLYGSSPVMLDLYQQIERVAGTDATALIIGESGTGKELIARTIHDQSSRKDAPFVAVNCGAIPDELIEAELFGHEKGSFTGAVQGRVGYFEHANGGTLFLDEITEMAPVRQVKLLRALETGTFYRVGGNDLISGNVRVIAATNRDPAIAVKENGLREDLMYRLAVFPLRAPPLRERENDRELLAQHFLAQLNQQEGTSKSFSKRSIETLRTWSWPGNVRELKNAVYRAFILAEKIVELPHPHLASRVKKPDDAGRRDERMDRHAARRRAKADHSRHAQILRRRQTARGQSSRRESQDAVQPLERIRRRRRGRRARAVTSRRGTQVATPRECLRRAPE